LDFPGRQARSGFLDFYEASGLSLEHHHSKLSVERGWREATDWAPHDANVRKLGTGTVLGDGPHHAPQTR
jgi:hypothetical protein